MAVTAGSFLAVMLLTGGTAATAAAARPRIPATDYQICNSDSGRGGCIAAAVVGQDAVMSDTTAHSFQEIDVYDNCASEEGDVCAKFEDTTTHECLKADPNITGRPIVGLACTSSETSTTGEEETFAEPTPGADGMPCAYSDDQYTNLNDNIDSDVVLATSSAYGNDWLLDG